MTQEFYQNPPHLQFNKLFEAIVQAIDEASEPAFLLPALLKTFEWINHLKLTDEPFHIRYLEFWLIHFSSKSRAEQLKIRGKLMGKYIPRDAYQAFFPIGMDLYYPGTHFVTAHLSPDLDTTVASFIGWLDAFAAIVGEGMHLWQLPGGMKDFATIKLFERLFGPGVEKSLARTSLSLSLTSLDLIEKKHVYKALGDTSITKIDRELHQTAFLMIDQEGTFKGDWHSRDAEKVRPILLLFQGLMRQFQNSFYIAITRLLSYPEVSKEQFNELNEKTLNIPFDTILWVDHLTEEEKSSLNDFLTVVIKIDHGLHGTMEECAKELELQGAPLLFKFMQELKNFPSSFQFDAGKLKESRSNIFQALEKLFSRLEEALEEVRIFSETLQMGIRIKQQVFQEPTPTLYLRNEVEEIRSKMGLQDYLPVLLNEQNKTYALGVIRAYSLLKNPLGTVSFRDFSNYEEVRLAPYLNVISIIDHHKSTVQTASPALILIGDAQSCNTLVAEQLFLLNDAFRNSKTYFVHPEREIAEYFACLYAILDDTDLLTKTSTRDVECIAEILNRLKALITHKTERCVDLSSITRDEKFSSAASQLILKNQDMRSIYEKIVLTKAEEIELALKDLNEAHLQFLFSDTKEQNGCCRIGQIKLYSHLFPLFQQKSDLLEGKWLTKAEQIYQGNPLIDLHIMMISTIASVDDLYKGQDKYPHMDQLWIWAAPSREGHTHLALFLNQLQNSPHIQEKVLKWEIFGDDTGELEQIVQQNFLTLPINKKPGAKRVAILYVVAGSLNSRKSMISPYLPKNSTS